MLTYALIGLALADPPDAAPAVVGGFEGGVRDPAVSGDGRLVTGINGSSVVMLGTDDWNAAQAAPCNAEGAAPALTGSSTIDVWVGCDDGTIRLLGWDDGVVFEDTSVEWPVGSGDPLVGIWWHEGTGTIWVAEQDPDTDQVFFWSVDASSGAVSDNAIEGFVGFVDGEVVDDALYVAQGGIELTRIGLDTGVVSYSLEPTTVLDIVDIAPAPGATVYGVHQAGFLAEYDNSFARWDILKSDLGSADAVGASLIESDAWVAVAEGSTVEVFRIVENVPSTTVFSRFSVDGSLSDIVVGGDGYAFGGGDAAGLVVLTANPWIDAVSASPTSGTDGTEITLSFTVRDDVNWAVYIGGDRTGSGDRIADGSAAEDDTVAVTLTIDDSWAEGRNPVFVVATDSDGNEGHGAAYVTVDNPPGAPDMGDATLEFGDEQLIFSFDGVSDEDLDHYDVYVSDAPFDPADFPVGTAGGPDGPSGLDTPIVVNADPGERSRVTIAPLENDRTYYVAVRAVDAGGLEGPMSDVIDGMPRETFGAAELAGEQGGGSCATGGGSASAMLAAAGLLAIRRRRVAAVALAVGISGTAAAQDYDEPEELPRTDITATFGGFSMRYGGIALDDSRIEAVYGDTGNQILQVEAGPQILRPCRSRTCGGIFEFPVGFGFFQELAFTVASDGTPSGERTMMTWFPLTADAMIRGQVLDEQILVPYGRFGFDYVLWSEQWDAGDGGKDKIKGGKAGYHYGFGANLLLDPLGRSRASLLEAQSGINDTYFTIEWRWQNVDDDGQGLDFSGRMITAGLTLDY